MNENTDKKGITQRTQINLAFTPKLFGNEILERLNNIDTYNRTRNDRLVNDIIFAELMREHFDKPLYEILNIMVRKCDMDHINPLDYARMI